MDYWKEKGFGTSYRMSFNNAGMKPNDELVAFFGWDKEQVDQLTRLGKETVEAIKAWEGDNAVCIEDSDEKLVYEIPEISQDIADQYLAAMAEILDPEDMALLSTKLEKEFEPRLQTRTATLTIGPAPDKFRFPNQDDDQQYMIVQIGPKQDGSKPFHGGGTRTSLSPYAPGKSIPYPWDHIFKLEGEEGYILPDGTWHPIPGE